MNARGGAGFIGSHLVNRLLDQNYEAKVIDNLTTGHLDNFAHDKTKNLHIIRGDIRNLNEVKSARAPNKMHVGSGN